MTVHALFISNHDDPEAWRAALADEMPALHFSAWPDCDDLSAIDVALVWKPAHGILARLPNLKLICGLGMGVDFLFADPQLPAHIPIARLIDRSLIEQMSEYVCFAALYHHRRIAEYERFQHERHWQQLPPPDTSKRRVGILGLGEIGGDCARKLRALGFPVHGWSRSHKTIEGVESFFGQQGLQPFLQRSDILVCLLPLTDETENIIDADLLAKLPRGAYLINVARGGHVDEQALLAALNSDHLAGAALDVFQHEPLAQEHPFWQHPKVRITPHIAGLTFPKSAAPQVAENIRRLCAGDPILNLVDANKQY